MTVPALLLACLGITIGVAALGVTVIGVRATWTWRHEGRRFQLMLVGTVASFVAALLAGRAVLDRQALADPPGILGLLPLAAVPLLMMALRAAFLREDRRDRSERLSAPVHPLTGLPSRLAFLALLQPALGRCRREGSPASILVAEIDIAEAIEDQRGPEIAREILRDFATILTATIRLGDLVGHAAHARLAVFLPGATEAGARRQAARLLAAVASQIVHPDMDGDRVSVSMGIAPIGEGTPAAVIEEALSAAEQALAVARRQGRGGVAVAPEKALCGASDSP
jgi:diguanylate cyclase (GGDEF)-like protein